MQLPLEMLSGRSESLRVSAALKLKCRERLALLHASLGKAGIVWPMPSVSFELRGRTAGQALWPSNHVRLNAVLLVENPQAFLDTVIGHELAHLATHARWGVRVKAHGVQWQSVMRLLGLAPQRCHELDTSRAAVSKPTHRYVCGCTEPHWLTPRRHGMARKRGYLCRRCHQRLRHEPLAGTQRPSAPLSRPSPARGAPSSGGALRPPSAAMLSYARGLAHRQSVAVPADVADSFEACRAFIARLRAGSQGSESQGAARVNLSIAPSVPLPAQALREPALRSAPSGATAPTDGQLRFARGLAQRLGEPVPSVALTSREALSAWLDEQGARMSRG